MRDERILQLCDRRMELDSIAHLRKDGQGPHGLLDHLHAVGQLAHDLLSVVAQDAALATDGRLAGPRQGRLPDGNDKSHSAAGALHSAQPPVFIEADSGDWLTELELLPKARELQLPSVGDVRPTKGVETAAREVDLSWSLRAIHRQWDAIPAGRPHEVETDAPTVAARTVGPSAGQTQNTSEVSDALV